MPSIQVLKIDATHPDYHGCGKAWAAVRDDNVVAIRYMDPNLPIVPDSAPAWVRAVVENEEGLDSHDLPTAWSSVGLSRIAKAAQLCQDCPRPPRRDRFRPKELLSMARAFLVAWQSAEFSAHRERCRAELAALGEVRSGMCSCFEFVIDR